MIKGINHITFSVSNLAHSIKFYKNILGAKPLVSGRTTAYFDLKGLWLALNEEKDVPRFEVDPTYTHIAFSIDETDFDKFVAQLKQNHVKILQGRTRDERDKRSVYFVDPDGHRLECHTGTLNDRLTYYRNTKHHMTFYEEED